MEDWRLQFKHGALVIWPPFEVRKEVNTLRRKYDPLSHAIVEAHITVTQPFLKKPNKSTWEEIHKILRKFPTLEIFFGPIDNFKNTSIMKFQIKPKKKLLTLRKVLHETGFFNLDLPFTESFIPHMTISEFDSRDQKETKKIVKALNRSSTKGSFLCSELKYAQPDDKFKFHIKKTLPLKSVKLTG
jgi:2'-5' RNA ligase